MSFSEISMVKAKTEMLSYDDLEKIRRIFLFGCQNSGGGGVKIVLFRIFFNSFVEIVFKNNMVIIYSNFRKAKFFYP